MVKNAFIVTCGFILGALVIENKHYFNHQIPLPVAVLPDAGVYDGTLNRGLFQGRGRIVWPDESYYEGEFDQGLFQGMGLLQTPTYVYEGDFHQGQASGEGTIDFFDGSQYHGEVLFGLASGYGVLETNDSVYRGQFKNDRYHGQGEIIYALGPDNHQNAPSGDRYIGAFEKGLYHGKGAYTRYVSGGGSDNRPDKQSMIIYSGDFIRGQFTGEGVWVNGTKRYEGEFLDWQFHGQGIYSDPLGSYTGMFVDGLYQGSGVYLGADGVKYEGEFLKGRYHGQGELVDAEKNSYQGAFQYGLKHGTGRITYAESLDGIESVSGEWKYGELISANHPQLVVKKAALVEHALYQQSSLIGQQLAQLQDNNPDEIDLYFVGVAGDGNQGVFRREVTTIQQLFDGSLSTEGKSLLLVNSPLTYQTIPLATVTSIQQTLQGVAEKMDAENDILFLYLTSHGSKDFTFYLSQPGLALGGLSADVLGDIVSALPVKHKVVVISACYSGGFVKPLKDSMTMLITAASADKASFGCSDRSTMTYFGEAFFNDALPQSASFVEAFDRARDIVKGREAKEGFENSNPLIYKPKAIVEHLQKWRNQLQQKKSNAQQLGQL